MPIVFRCIRCQKTLRVGDEAAGKKARCPDCGTIQDVVASISEVPTGADNIVRPSELVGQLPLPSNDKPFGDNPFSSSGSSSINPFSDANPFADAAGQSANPYAAPLQGGIVSSHSQLTYLQRRTIAESKVKAPALSLFVFQIIVLVVQVFQVLVMLFGGNVGPNEAMFALLPVSVNLGFSGVILFGAWKMYRVRGYPWAMAAAILAMLPCSGCCVVGMPLGVWALVILNDSIVKSAFD